MCDQIWKCFIAPIKAWFPPHLQQTFFTSTQPSTEPSNQQPKMSNEELIWGSQNVIVRETRGSRWLYDIVSYDARRGETWNEDMHIDEGRYAVIKGLIEQIDRCVGKLISEWRGPEEDRQRATAQIARHVEYDLLKRLS
jgi:hypothetical protein